MNFFLWFFFMGNFSWGSYGNFYRVLGNFFVLVSLGIFIVFFLILYGFFLTDFPFYGFCDIFMGFLVFTWRLRGLMGFERLF